MLDNINNWGHLCYGELVVHKVSNIPTDFVTRSYFIEP